jgi:ankyrin repeat protein
MAQAPPSFMVKSGFSVEVRNRLEMTPLSWAALLANHKERRAVVEMLLSLGADPNAKDDKGFTPLDLISDPSKNVAVLIQKHGGRLAKDLPG